MLLVKSFLVAGCPLMELQAVFVCCLLPPVTDVGVTISIHILAGVVAI
jgi:hypothetical protein